MKDNKNINKSSSTTQEARQKIVLINFKACFKFLFKKKFMFFAPSVNDVNFFSIFYDGSIHSLNFLSIGSTDE